MIPIIIMLFIILSWLLCGCAAMVLMMRWEKKRNIPTDWKGNLIFIPFGTVSLYHAITHIIKWNRRWKQRDNLLDQ